MNSVRAIILAALSLVVGLITYRHLEWRHYVAETEAPLRTWIAACRADFEQTSDWCGTGEPVTLFTSEEEAKLEFNRKSWREHRNNFAAMVSAREKLRLIQPPARLAEKHQDLLNAIDDYLASMAPFLTLSFISSEPTFFSEMTRVNQALDEVGISVPTPNKDAWFLNY